MKIKIIFLSIFFIFSVIIFLNMLYNSKKEYDNELKFRINKIDTLKSGRILVNDTFLSPNFYITPENNIKLGDSIIKLKRVKVLNIYRNGIKIDSINSSGLLYSK